MTVIKGDLSRVEQHEELHKQLDYLQALQLEHQFSSPLYILNVHQLQENYRKMYLAFKSRYENFIIGYSYKTNYIPYLCKVLHKMGAYAEVVSRLEYDLALKLGVAPEHIIFNGPIKHKDDYFLLLKNRSIVNIDSSYEIEFVKDYCVSNPDKIVEIGIRVNFDLHFPNDSDAVLQEGYSISRFGICVENGSLENVIKEIREIPNVKLVGFHGHFSTRNRAVKNYETITRRLCQLAKTYIPEGLKYIDVGGGIYGEMHASFKIKTPTFEDYANAICEIMNNEFQDYKIKPALILEPGISIVANTVQFLAKVIETKKVRDQYFVLINGSVHNIKPTMHKHNLPMRILRDSEHGKQRTSFHIVGYTCMEKDYISINVEEVLPKRGDYIVFENVGAYTIVFNPPFIQTRPGVIAYENSTWTVIRKQEQFEQFFSEEIYLF